MELSPQKISEFEFDLVRRGYDPEQVRPFLQRLGGAVEEMQRHLISSDARARAAMARVHELSAVQQQTPIGPSVGDAEAITKTLMLAQRTADELTSNADTYANETVAAAEERARTLVEDAERRTTEYVQRTESDARIRIESELSGLAERRASLQNEADILRGQIAEMRDQISSSIEELQRVLGTSKRGHSRAVFADDDSFGSGNLGAPLAAPASADGFGPPPGDPAGFVASAGWADDVPAALPARSFDTIPAANGAPTTLTPPSGLAAEIESDPPLVSAAVAAPPAVKRMTPSNQEMSNGQSVLDGVDEMWSTESA
jgi:DivIVA domain-containing protein